MKSDSLEIRKTFFARGFPRTSSFQDNNLNKQNGDVNKQYCDQKKIKLRNWIKIWNMLILVLHFSCFIKKTQLHSLFLYISLLTTIISSSFLKVTRLLDITRCTGIYSTDSTNHSPHFSCMFWTFLSYWLCHPAPWFLNWFYNLFVYQTQKN